MKAAMFDLIGGIIEKATKDAEIKNKVKALWMISNGVCPSPYLIIHHYHFRSFLEKELQDSFQINEDFIGAEFWFSEESVHKHDGNLLHLHFSSSSSN